MYSIDQLAATESAIASLAAGAQEVEDAFGNRVRRPQLKDLIALKERMEADVAKAARRSGYDKMKFARKQ